jgi:hypothetical protein
MILDRIIDAAGVVCGVSPIVANPDGSPIPVGASLLANLMRREKEGFASKLAPTVQVVNLTAGGV